MKDLYLIGASGFGREVADTVRSVNDAAGEDGVGRRGGQNGEVLFAFVDGKSPFDEGPVYRIAGYIDDDASKWGLSINGVEVVGGIDFLKALALEREKSGTDEGVKPYVALALGEPKTKKLLAEKLEGFVLWETIIHPTAVISPYCRIGQGSILQAGAFVGPNVQMGRHCCLNVNSGIGHDAVIGDFSSIMGNCDVTGGVVLKEGVYVSTCVGIIPSLTIGENAVIGAGAVVIRDVEAGATVVGNPARRIK
jgi:sugar O-acyltransferase (sialic acid O-acetyltransferase NeuD family)